MGRRFKRREILERIRENIADKRTTIGAGCSAGIIAKCAELGGADLIICYSTGQSRIWGLPTTQVGHANPTTMGMFEEIQNVVKSTPIIAGVEANDPTCYDLGRLLRRFIDLGYDGIINFPTMGQREMVPRQKAQNEQRGRALGIPWGFPREVEMIRMLRSWDVFTMCYVFSPEQAADMVRAGVDVVCAHVGGTAGGLVGFKADNMEMALQRSQRIIERAKAVDKNVICLAHGGPFAEPEDTKALYESTDAQGFVGASSIERIPVEKAVMEAVKAFKSFQIKQ